MDRAHRLPQREIVVGLQKGQGFLRLRLDQDPKHPSERAWVWRSRLRQKHAAEGLVIRIHHAETVRLPPAANCALEREKELLASRNDQTRHEHTWLPLGVGARA